MQSHAMTPGIVSALISLGVSGDELATWKMQTHEFDLCDEAGSSGTRAIAPGERGGHEH